jgi:hypothetical protein
MRRLGRFFYEWAATLIGFESLSGFAWRLIAFILYAAGWVRFLGGNVQIYAVSSDSIVIETGQHQVGTLIVLGLFVVGLVFSAGLAFERSSVPVLRMDSHLFEDSQDRLFRIRFTHGGGPTFRARAEIIELTDDKNQRLLPIPFDLTWQNCPGTERPEMSQDDERFADVAFPSNAGLIFAAATEPPRNRPVASHKVYLKIKSTVPDVKNSGRRSATVQSFSLEKDSSCQLGYKARTEAAPWERPTLSVRLRQTLFRTRG